MSDHVPIDACAQRAEDQGSRARVKEGEEGGQADGNNQLLKVINHLG
jgi:hypothetical protein